MNIVQKRNLAIATCLGCIAAVATLIALNIHVAVPGESIPCNGGICWDLITQMSPTMALTLVLVGIATFSGNAARHYHRDCRPR